MALGSWWRHIMSDMKLVWHVGRCTWLAHWYMHMVGILVDTHDLHVGRGIWLIHSIDDILWHIVDVHGCCAWWAHFGT